MSPLVPILAVSALGAIYLATRQSYAYAPDTTPSTPAEPAPWGLDAQTGEGTEAVDTIPTDDQTQTASTVQEIFYTVTQPTWGNDTNTMQDANVKAFLDMIAFAEGTTGDRGYLTMFGYRYATSYADHPRQRFTFTNSKGQTLTTSAAGRYQFLISTWDELKKKLGLPDFSPESQDAAAIELIRQRGALPDVKAGRITDAIAKVSKVWASLPGAGYAQPERKLSQLLAAYSGAGGQTLGA